MNARLVAPCAALACAVAPAQILVGPGGAYADIAAAAAAAPDGAVLVVQPGTYGSFAIVQKSLTVLGGPGVVVGDAATTIEVRDLTAAQRVALRGLTITSASTDAVVRVEDNQGVVLLDALFGGSAGGGARLVADANVDLRVHACLFEASTAPPLSVAGGGVRADDSVFAVPLVFPPPGQPPIATTAGMVELTDTTVTNGLFSSTPALVAATELRVLGGTWILATTISGSGRGRLDAEAQTPAFPSTFTMLTGDFPSVAASTEAIGGVATGTLEGSALDHGWLFAGPAATAAPWLPGYELLLDDAALLAAGPLATPLTGSYAVPALPALRGVWMTWQGVAFAPATGLRASNAVTYVHY